MLSIIIHGDGVDLFR